MMIKRIDKNYYEIKIYKKIDFQNIFILKELTKKIVRKINRKYKLRNEIDIEIYPSNFLTILVLKDYNNIVNKTNKQLLKINVYTDTIFLYEIDYFDISLHYGNIYFYDNKFYLNLKEITKKEYLYLSEHSHLIYQNTEKIIKNGLKINI